MSDIHEALTQMNELLAESVKAQDLIDEGRKLFAYSQDFQMKMDRAQRRLDKQLTEIMDTRDWLTSQL